MLGAENKCPGSVQGNLSDDQTGCNNSSHDKKTSVTNVGMEKQDASVLN